MFGVPAVPWPAAALALAVIRRFSARHRATALVAAFALAAGASASAQRTVRVGVNDLGAQPGGVGSSLAVSRDGRHVAFASSGSNLDSMQADTNGAFDVFVHDRVTARTVRVSVSTSGAEGDGASWEPSLSADGRFVAFDSKTTTLATGANGVRQVYVHDRDTDQDGVFDEPGARATVLISRTPAGAAGAGRSRAPSISGNGRYVAFTSTAPDLVAGDVNGHQDVFVHDRDADGDGVLDETHAGATLTLRAADGVEPDGRSQEPRIADQAPVVVFTTAATTFAGDATADLDVVAWDFAANRYAIVSATPSGQQADAPSAQPDVSADGRFVVFRSLAGNLSSVDQPFVLDVFLHDRDADGNGVLDELGGTSNTLVTTIVAGAGSAGLADSPRVSDDGGCVSFLSLGADLVANDTNGKADVFVWERATGRTVRASVASDGAQAGGSSSAPEISGDGLHVAFQSLASDLVVPDANLNGNDAYVRACPVPELARSLYCTGKTSSAGCVPFLTVEGCASTTSSERMSIRAEDVLPGQRGILIHGPARRVLGFHGGHLCVRAPFERSPRTKTVPAAGACTQAALVRDFNATIRSGADPLLTTGATVHAQWIQDDPADPAGFGDSFTDAVRFVIVP